MPSRTRPSASADQDRKPRLPWAVVAFSTVTMASAVLVGLSASDHFTRLTMLAGILACIALWQTLRDPLVICAVTTMVLGAVLGWGMNFYDRIWWYDDLIHFLFSFVGVAAIARLALHRFRADSVLLLLTALWLAWLGIGSLWEIAEWASDQLDGTGHSRGYADTMYDMILNSAGSAIGVWAYWRWLRTPADRLVAAAADV